MEHKPLEDLRVVDLTHVLAGPYCTYQLGLLGADVIKVESLSGDMVRSWGGSAEQLERKLGSGFVSQNAGKRSLSIDITSIAASTGTPPAPAGNRDAPMLGRFKAREGYVMLAGYLPHHCRSLCAALDLLEYAEFSGREFAQRGEEIEQAVEARITERTALEWDDIFSQAGVVGGGVRDVGEVLATGQPEARELLTSVSSAAGEFKVTTNGYRINDKVFTPAFGVPMLGQHTLEILADLGLDEMQISELEKDGIIHSETIE